MRYQRKQIYYADYIPLPLPEGHRFPADKYALCRMELKQKLGLPDELFVKSPLATREKLEQVHCPIYVEKVFSGRLSSIEQKKIGFPWSSDLVKRCLASTGGTYAAVLSALENGYSAQLAGGTHHAHFDFGAGYCVFNDFAYAVKQLLEERSLSRISVIDLDVHHGDGNATMFRDLEQVFVLSLHGSKNYPLRKPPSSYDVALPDKIEDSSYLQELSFALSKVRHFAPELILYQAGVDPLADDQLGRMNLTSEGLKARDRFVFALAHELSIPIMHVLGGGYARPIRSTVEAYVNTFAVAQEVLGL